jgi:predicted Zn finger-like uncharacterized protein
MVVQCTNCQARFRVADEKVPERGVKVRCTKCSTVFRVTRADAVDVKPAASRDPFGLSTGRNSSSPNQAPGSNTGPHALVNDFGLGGAPATPFGSPDAPPHGGRVVPHMPPAVSLTYGAASPHQSLDLDLSLGPPSAPNRPLPPMPPMSSPGTPSPSPNNYNGAGSFGRNGATTGPSAIDAAFAQGMADPFADLVGGQQAAPAPPPRPPPPMDPFADLDSRPPAAAFGDPFADGPPSGAGNSGQGFVAPQGYPVPPPQRSAPPADPWVNLLQSQPKEETDPFAGLDSAPPVQPPSRDLGREAPRAENRPEQLELDAPNAAGEAPRMTGRAGAGLPPVAGGAGEFEMGEATRGHKLDLDYKTVGLDNFSSLNEPEPKQERPRERVETGRDAVEIGRVMSSGKQAPAAKVVEEKPKAVDQKAVARGRFRRELASAVFNIASACVVFYAGIVAIAWVRAPRAIGLDDIGFPMVHLAFGSASEPGEQLRATQIHTGIYPTHAGGELFYVEGMAENTSTVRYDALYADVEITRGDHEVKSAKALVQLHATPEHLWALDSRKNDDLQKALMKDAPSLEMEPHKSAPFIAVFMLTAKDVEGCDVRVSIHAGIPPGLRASPPPDPKGEPPAIGDKEPQPGHEPPLPVTAKIP